MKRVLFILGILCLLSVFPSVVIFQDNATGETGYVGVEVCKGCHEPYYQGYIKSVHGKKAVPGSPANKYACESCHGPGAAHVEKGGGRGTGIFPFGRKAAPKDKSARCLSCHAESRRLAFWDMSRHKINDISCDRCHSIHSGGEKYLRGREPVICYGCHKDINSMVNRQSHHPLDEGKIKCTSCHDPHGTFGPKMITADSVNELCYKCHAEKRGPFMWEHPPAEENCLNCHLTHGSNHNRLLVMKTPQLCQQCHDGAFHPGTPWTQFSSFVPPASIPKVTAPAAQLVGRACLNCHNDVHGTNGPSAYGQRFLK